MANDLVCIDTQILIWGVRRPNEPAIQESQQDKIPRAENFIEWLQREKKRIMVPSVALAEWLVPIPLEFQRENIAKISKGFQIQPFDIAAATKFAELRALRIQDGTIDSLLETGLYHRDITADGMIVATAIAHKAKCIYSDDLGVSRFAGATIECSEMPDIYGQIKMFDYEQEPQQSE